MTPRIDINNDFAIAAIAALPNLAFWWNALSSMRWRRMRGVAA